MTLGKYITDELRQFHIACSSNYGEVDIRDLNFFLVLLEVELSRLPQPERLEIDISTGLDFLDHAILLGVKI